MNNADTAVAALHLVAPYIFAGFIAAIYILLRNVQTVAWQRLVWALFGVIAAPFAALAIKEKTGMFGAGIILGGLAIPLLYEVLYRTDFVVKLWASLKGRQS
jgi:hypothetical protein